MDKREDAGEFYPGGKVISTRPVATGGDVKHSDFAGLDVKTNTIPDLREAVRELGRRLGATVVTALAACVAIAATVQTVPVNDLDFDANPSIVTNVVFDAPPDYSTNNTALVATIEATAPAPGDYANVSNAAVHAAITNALQDAALASLSSLVSLSSRSSTNYVDVTLGDWESNLGIQKNASWNKWKVEWAHVSDESDYATLASRLLYNGDEYDVDGILGAVDDKLSDYVPYYRTINGYSLYNDITLTGEDITVDDGIDSMSANGIAASLRFDVNNMMGHVADIEVIYLPSKASTEDLANAATAATNYTDAAISPTSPAFSNAVLSVGLGIDTNTVAAINELVDSSQGLPVSGMTSVGALLLALAAAIAALKKRLPYALVAKTIENGAVTLDDRADNYVDARTLGSSDSLDIDFPALVDGKSRDFVLAVECGANPPAISYAAFVTIMAEDASSLTPEEGMNIYAFTEFKTNMFLASRKTVDTVVVNTPESIDQLLLAMQKRGIDTTNITDFGGVESALGLSDTATPQDAIDAVMN